MRSEIGHQGLRLGFGDPQVGHEHALLDALRITDPAREIFVGVLESASREVRAGTDVTEIRPHHTLGGVHRSNGVAGDTTFPGEELLSLGILLVSTRRGGFPWGLAPR